MALLKVVSTLTLTILLFIIGYVNQTVGWGMEVKSWPTIIGCFALSMIVTVIVTVVSAIED